MGWLPVSRIKIATALHYPMQQFYLIDIDAGMSNVAKQGQEAIDYVESLLAEYALTDAALASGAADAGLIQADTLHWSDRAGARLSGEFDRLALLADRIAAALNIQNMAGNANSGACRSSRS
jgi:hypothetical protein